MGTASGAGRRRIRFREKLDWMGPLVAGREVLYIGCVDENAENFHKHGDTQAALAGRASALLGVYASPAQAEALERSGSRALAADVEALALGRRFEVIVAADNIEHLSNCGRFLAALERHLAPGGSLLVSTPNPTSLVRILEVLALGRAKANVEHTLWLSGQVLDQLARRCGLRVAEEVFIDEMRRYHRAEGRGWGAGRRLATRLLVALNGPLCRLFPQLSETFGFVLVRCAD